jgi:hydrogenase maturation protease
MEDREIRRNEPGQSERCSPDVHQRGEILILALGNSLRGDDGAGSAVLEELRKKNDLPKTVTLIDGGIGGLETILLMQDYRHVILIDAAELRRTAGEWVHITYQDEMVEFKKTIHHDSLHRVGLAEALELAETLNMLPSNVILYAIQPAQINWSTEISPQVNMAIPEICIDICNWIDRIIEVSA